MRFIKRATSVQLDQVVDGNSPLARECNSLPIRALSGLGRLVRDIGGRGLSPNRTISGVAHLLKIKTYLRKGN